MLPGEGPPPPRSDADHKAGSKKHAAGNRGTRSPRLETAGRGRHKRVLEHVRHLVAAGCAHDGVTHQLRAKVHRPARSSAPTPALKITVQRRRAATRARANAIPAPIARE